MSLTIATTSSQAPATRALKAGSQPVIDLMSRVLRDGRPLEGEYPLVFREGFPGKLIRLGDANGTYSGLSVLPRELVTSAGRLPVVLIGSVCTDPAHQGKGLAARALEAAEEFARERGAVATLLWADHPGYYCSRGYRAVGAEIDVQLSAALLPRLDQSGSIREASPNDSYMIHALQMASPVRVSRKLPETQALLQIPGSKTLVWESEGEVRAYASMGKGEDLTNVIHEWGGETEGVLALARAHAEARLSVDPEAQVYLIAPDAPLEVTQKLVDLGFPTARGVLAMGKLTDRSRALLALASITGTKQEDAEKATSDLSDRELLQCLLPARSESETAIQVASRLGVEPGRLAMFAFVSGFDSI